MGCELIAVFIRTNIIPYTPIQPYNPPLMYPSFLEGSKNRSVGVIGIKGLWGYRVIGLKGDIGFRV